MSSKWRQVLGLGLLLAFYGVPGARAQSGETQETYQPPVVQFQQGGIGILEAARLTLQHDPNIKLQDASAESQRGVAQEQTGVFDLSLLANLSYEYRQQELSESRKELEQQKRDRLDEAIRDNQQGAAQAAQLLASLRQAQINPPGATTLPDPTLNAELLIIDTLINQVTNPQARQELFKVRTEFLQAAIQNTERALQESLDRYAEAIQTRQQIGDTPQDEVFYNGTVQVQFSKLFRNGINIAPFFEGTFEGENFKGKPRSQDFGGKGIEDLFTFRVGLNGVLPLLRGRGSDATGAFEKSSRIDHDASLAVARHQSSASVLSAVSAYWDLRATQELVEVARRSVELQTRLVELTQALIDAGELPPADIARVQASQASSQARLDDATRQLHQARVNLARVMGVTVTGDETTLPLASDAFPAVSEALYEDEELVNLMRGAEERRQDLAAARLLEESGQVLVRGAQTDTRPRMDVVGGTWFTALGERSINKAMDRWVGPSVNIGLEFEKPFGNNLYRGRLVQSEADLLQRAIDSVDLGRQIKLAIVQSARSLAEAASRVRQADDSVRYYQATIDAEIAKFQSGDSTLIDVVLTEEQQVGARSEFAVAQAEYAKLLAELRYQAGLLVAHQAGASVITQESLVTLPLGAPRR